MSDRRESMMKEMMKSILKEKLITHMQDLVNSASTIDRVRGFNSRLVLEHNKQYPSSVLQEEAIITVPRLSREEVLRISIPDLPDQEEVEYVL